MRNFIQTISHWNSDRVLTVLGPTGSGKTKAVLDHVQKTFAKPNTPLIVSVDSVAVFKEISIGTSKPTDSERIPYDWVGLDLFSIDFKPSAKDYYENVWPKIEEALIKNRPVILVGGSHFYEKVLVEGFRPGSESDADFILSLKMASSKTLLENLMKKDPRWENFLHVNDRYRLERFSDLVIRQGFTFENLKGAGNFSNIGGVGSVKKDPVDTLVLGLDVPPASFESLLNKRIQQMLEMGWLGECRNLLGEGADPKCAGFQSVGYRQVIDFLLSGGKVASKALIEDILISHRQLAKKQRTWLRGVLNQDK